MKKSVLVLLFWLAGAVAAPAQTYYYAPQFYYNQPRSYSYPPQYYYVYPQQPQPLYMAPRPYIYKQWDRHNRMLDMENLLRRPGDESDLEYMLRDF